MVDSKSFNSYVSLEMVSRKNMYAEFTKNEVVLCIKKATKNLEKTQQDNKGQLVALLVESYPKEWIRSLLSVGCKTMDNATDRVLEHIIGAAIPHIKKSTNHPGKITGG